MEFAVSSNTSSKTREPPSDMINSILTNLNNGSEKQAAKKCKHFTLRGHVAEMRKKDWKRTWPFPISYYSSTSEEEHASLPPLHVPEFRRWNCRNCLQEIGAKLSDADVGAAALVSNVGRNEPKSESTNLSSLGGSAMPSGSHQPSKPATTERIEIDLNKSATVETSKELSSSGDDNDGRAKMTGITIKGNETRLKHNVQGTHVSTSSVAVEVNSGMMPETQTVKMVSNAVPVKSRCNGAVVLDKASRGSHNSVDVDLLDSEEEASETGVVSARNVNQDNNDTSSNPLQRRKPRKTRLMIDLLGEYETPKAKHCRVEDLSQNQYASISSGTVPVGLDSKHENSRTSKGHNRKRKSSQDGGGAEVTGVNGCYKLKDANFQPGTSNQPDHSKIWGQAIIPFQVEEGQTSVTRNEGRHHCGSSAQDPFLGQRRASFDLNRKATPYRVPNLNIGQSFEAEHAPLFPVQPSDFCVTTSNEKHMETQEHLASRRLYGDQVGKLISEQGATDDVPMDIVELMAKNQYERRLGNNVNNMSTPNQARAPQWLLNTNSQQLDWSSNRVQFPASSSSRPSSNRGVKRNADILVQGPKYTNMQGIGACNTRQLPQQGEEAASHWPSRTPNHMPLISNIAQKCTTRPMNMDVSSHYPWQKGNTFLKLNAPVLESCRRNIPAENYSRTQAEYPQTFKHARIDLNQSPVGPMDLNSKETISAMQLLSLMDAGMRSGPSFNADSMPKFFNRTPRPQVGCSSEFSSPQSMINKTTSTIIPPRSTNLSMHCHLEISNRYFQSVPTAEASTSTMQRKITGSFNSMILPLSSGSETVGSSSYAVSSRRISESEICTVNQNPADLTSPGPENEYMIRRQDLTCRDTIPPRNRSRQTNASHSAAKRRSSKS